MPAIFFQGGIATMYTIMWMGAVVNFRSFKEFAGEQHIVVRVFLEFWYVAFFYTFAMPLHRKLWGYLGQMQLNSGADKLQIALWDVLHTKYNTQERISVSDIEKIAYFESINLPQGGLFCTDDKEAGVEAETEIAGASASSWANNGGHTAGSKSGRDMVQDVEFSQLKVEEEEHMASGEGFRKNQ